MLPYHPALRFKQGEYFAAAKIARDIQKYVFPRFIIPPPKERDPEKGAPLTPEEIACLTGVRIAKHWPLLPAFLDPQYVAPVLGTSGLEKLFSTAQASNNKLVAVATLGDLHEPSFRKFMSGTWPRLGVYFRYDEVDGHLLKEGLDAIGCLPQDCAIFVDFTGAELSPEIATGSVSGIFDHLGEIARWGRIIFQGSVFPPTNPADHDSEVLLPRDEWKTFHEAIKGCSVPVERVGYGDFGADCGEINFPRRSGGGRPIPHLRYTGATDTLVVRGKQSGSYDEVMTDVFKRVLNSGHFAGQAFSYADDEIWRRANGIGTCGNASMWREWNMAHHITRVVRDLGAMSGLSFENGRVSERPPEQTTLFPADSD